MPEKPVNRSCKGSSMFELTLSSQPVRGALQHVLQLSRLIRSLLCQRDTDVTKIRALAQFGGQPLIQDAPLHLKRIITFLCRASDLYHQVSKGIRPMCQLKQLRSNMHRRKTRVPLSSSPRRPARPLI